MITEMEALPRRTSRGPVPSYGPDPDVSEVGHVQRPVRGDHKRGWTVEPSVFSVAIARLIAVAVSVILSRRGKGHRLVLVQFRCVWFLLPLLYFMYTCNY